MEFRPDFSLTAEGQDITAAVRRGLVDITLTDFGGGTGNTDELRITVMSETLALPTKGARLQLALGFNGDLVDKGWFVVCQVESSGPPRKITITATAAPMNAAKHSGNVSNQKTRSFDDVTLGDIVKKVAKDNDLIPRIAKSLIDIRIEHIDQVRESDAALLLRLARMYNAVSKPSGGYWIFLEQGKSETASGKPLPATLITPDMVSSWNYSEGEKANAGDKKKGDVYVNYFDKATGETKSVKMEHGGADTHIQYTKPSEGEAKLAGKAKAAKSARNSRKMSVSMPCRPNHIGLTAEAKITTQGFGSREDKVWLTESLKYSLNDRGLTLDVSLVAHFDPKGKKNGEDGVNPF